MKTVKTILGDAKITFAKIRRTTSYGHYRITVNFSIGHEDYQFSFITTDSMLFDYVHGEDGAFGRLMEMGGYMIETELVRYCESL